MNSRKKNSIIKTIDKHMAKIAKDRDKLDDFIDELNSLRDDCDEAYDHLQRARDCLSELV